MYNFRRLMDLTYNQINFPLFVEIVSHGLLVQLGISNQIEEEIEGHPRSVCGGTQTVYMVAFDVYPDDVPGEETIFPTHVKADGDCLPSSGSVFAFGHEDRSSQGNAGTGCSTSVITRVPAEEQTIIFQHYKDHLNIKLCQ
jgi:hypothetical protein